MRQGFQLREVATLICVLCVVAAVGLPDYVRLKEHAREGIERSMASKR
jgi:hypothetical protein